MTNTSAGQTKRAAVGVDGCKLGWFYSIRESERIRFGVVPDLASLVDLAPESSLICIDIPIGLRDGGAEPRECDRLARRALGPRASSVFPAPAYPVLDARNYAEAKRLSLAATGKMLSQQAYAIAPKIREVNRYLAENRNPPCEIREVHPELCFWGLNARTPMAANKRKSEGFEERLSLLERFLPEARALVQTALQLYRAYQVGKDDILDALVAMVVASAPPETLKTLPEVPPRDSRGIRMEMVYAESNQA